MLVIAFTILSAHLEPSMQVKSDDSDNVPNKDVNQL